MTRRILSGESADEMWGSKSRKLPETDIDVTPLVDCVFLLLSFFMLTSPMKGDPDRNVPAAAHGVGVDPLGTTAIRIVDAEPNPRILLDNRESTVDDIRPFVEAGVRKGHTLVVIKADRKVPCGLVQKVAKAATAVAGVQFSLGVQDKKTQATATQ
jgi:biopolymer transport protein ExbD